MHDPDLVLVTLIASMYGMLGLCMGSFSTAIAHRIASGQSWIIQRQGDDVKPARSSCPSCGHVLSILDLIPFFSWVFLAGKCRYCRVKISVRYPAIELFGALTMILFATIVVNKWALLVFVVTLPFASAFILLFGQKIKRPIYINGLFFLNIFVWIYAVIYERGL